MIALIGGGGETHDLPDGGYQMRGAGGLPDPVLNIYVGAVDGFPEFSSIDFPGLDDRTPASISICCSR